MIGEIVTPGDGGEDGVYELRLLQAGSLLARPNDANQIGETEGGEDAEDDEERLEE